MRRARVRAALSSVWLVILGCGAADPASEPCVPRVARAAPLSLGVAHVAGDYHPLPGTPFVEAGARDAALLGARTLKLYLTPDYREKYPGDWPTVASLADLAQTPQLRAIFDGPFDTFVLTTYSFSLGVGDPWRSSDEPGLYAAEADEFEALARHLLQTYAGTGKRFVLQNWEGDWALRAGLAADTTPPPERAARMARWLDARQAGIGRARRAVHAEGVDVVHAIELNLAVAGAGGEVLRDVLPTTCVESVSYSAWDALAVDVGAPVEAQRTQLRAQLRAAVERVRAVVGDEVELALGEIGFAEAEHPAGQVPALLDATVTTAAELGVARAIYWQVYDNECTAAGCRGLWLVRPDGSWSEAAWAMTALLKSARP